uniref:Uncharacterized protein n=1 Tax=Rhizophora mucronata TaxID=61149 RepID=A0A2P2PLP3_RHIMU
MNYLTTKGEINEFASLIEVSPWCLSCILFLSFSDLVVGGCLFPL